MAGHGCDIDIGHDGYVMLGCQIKHKRKIFGVRKDHFVFAWLLLSFIALIGMSFGLSRATLASL